jgi:hypothetical protein
MSGPMNRNQKPFVCESNGYRANKLTGLMKAVGGTRHLIAEGTPEHAFTDALGQPLNPSIAGKLESLRGHSERYLTAALFGNDT